MTEPVYKNPHLAVIKVGGSLFDDPRLGPGLNQFLARLPEPRYLLVPGGGPVADAVREWDRRHGLGPDRAHDLALVSLWTTAALLRELVPGTEYAVSPHDYPSGHHILDSHMFCQLDGALPHSWDVTSDSIAARAAIAFGAKRLILLKSVDIPPGTPWAEAAERGWVDRYFPTAVGDPPVPVETLNFRGWLDQHFAAGTEV